MPKTVKESERLKIRLEGLMVLRVFLVTLLLGGAIAVDFEALSNLGEFRNAVYLGLIVGTYLVTIIYGLWWRIGGNERVQAIVQIGIDLLIITGLVSISGGLNSVFSILFFVTIMAAAAIDGRRLAFFLAAATCLGLAFVAAVDLGWVELETAQSSTKPLRATVFRFFVNGSAAFLVALLSGLLAERLGQAQEELKDQSQRIEDLKALNANILASMSSGLLSVDANETIIFFNLAAEEIIGISSEEALGKSLRDILPELATQTQSIETVRNQTLIAGPSGAPIYIGYSKSPLHASEEGGAIIVFQDLTEIRAMENQIRRSERMAAIGELSAGIAHEIRNPLASISGAVEMLEDSQDQSEEDRQLAGIVIREVERLNKLIGDFLNFARPQGLVPANISIESIIREVVGLAEQGDTKVKIRNGDLSSLPAIHADPAAVKQMLWNLVRNAAAASNEIQIDVRVRGDFLVVAVEDDGTGIPPELRERIFEPFFTTKSDGTGLGLAITFKLAEELGGSLTTQNPQKLSGARFEVKLPLSQETL